MALAGELIAFLAVFPAALAISLSRDHVRARPFAADVAGGEAKVDQAEAVLHAMRMMLQPPSVEGHGSPGFSEPVCRFLYSLGWDSGDFTNAVRVPCLYRPGHLIKSGGVLRNKI